VLLFAGGSGATFTLGLLDDLVGRIAKLGRPNGERTTRIEFAWCVRSFGSIFWFAPYLMDIAHMAAKQGSGLDLHITVFVTCLCDPEAVPDIPNMDVIIERPSASALLAKLTTAEWGSDEERIGVAAERGGGVAVCAAGPESLTRQTANAVAAASLRKGMGLGGIALHTEVFAM
jgi:hypothetical protein